MQVFVVQLPKVVASVYRLFVQGIYQWTSKNLRGSDASHFQKGCIAVHQSVGSFGNDDDSVKTNSLEHGSDEKGCHQSLRTPTSKTHWQHDERTWVFY